MSGNPRDVQRKRRGAHLFAEGCSRRIYEYGKIESAQCFDRRQCPRGGQAFRDPRSDDEKAHPQIGCHSPHDGHGSASCAIFPTIWSKPFKATLEEAASADLLIHVADASDPEVEIQMATTEKVLSEIGAGLVPRILVLNKIDIAEQDVIDPVAPVASGGTACLRKNGDRVLIP